MDGRNCTGRTISLLNDREGDFAATPHSPTSHHYQQQQQHHHHHHHHHHQLLDPATNLRRPALFHAHSRSSSSSCASSPSPLSPPLSTPALVRSQSSSSDSHAFHTPSPLTPSYTSFDFILPSASSKTTTTTITTPSISTAAATARQQRAQPYAQQYFIAPPSHSAKADKMDDLNHLSLYPPIPDATGAIPPSAYPMPMPMPVQMPTLQQMQGIPPPLSQMQHPQPQRASTSPASEPSRVSAQSATSNAKAQSKKNQYPCPMAKQFGCSDFFTTSGHAARHAKKHTGKKDAFCPECNKAFTRKDNMEQHRRTHQNGRGASRSTASAPSDDAKVKKTTKQTSKKTNVKVEPQLEAAVEQQLAEQQQQHQQQHQHQQLIDSQMAQAITLPSQQALISQSLFDQSIMLPPACGPYFIGGNGMDAIPVASLPMAMPDLSGRPQLQRSSYGMNNLDYIAPAAPMTISEEGLHYSYPSPGLSNGLNSLALAASEHQRLSQEKQMSQSPSCEQMRNSPSSSSDQTP